MDASNLPPAHPPHMRWRNVGDDDDDDDLAPVIVQDAFTGIHVPTHEVVPFPGPAVDLNFENLILGESNRPSDFIYSNAADNVLQVEALPGRINRMYGFEAEDLLNGNAVFCSPCRPSSLTAPSLKIFHPHNFIDTPDDTYRALIPALALAEKLILCGNPNFFITLVSGTRVVDEQLSKQHGKLMHRLHPPTNGISNHFTALTNLLENMGDRMQWRFEYKATVYGQYHGQDYVPRRALIPTWGAEDPFRRMVNITLHKDFYEIARAYAATQWPNEAQKLRFHFFLAVVICHELAHAIDAIACDAWWLSCCNSVRQAQGAAAVSRLPQRTEESLMGKFDTETELGAHFENSTFGGRIGPTGNLMHVKYGVLVHNGSLQPGPHQTWQANVLAQTPNVTAIPMTFMEELQQEFFWNRQDINRSLVIPYTGLTALNGRETTTVSWRDHLLDVEEGRRLANQFNPRPVGGVKRRVSTTMSSASTKRVMTEATFGRDQPAINAFMSRSRIAAVLASVQRNAQMPIRRYISKANVDEAELRKELIQASLREQWQASLERGTEYAAAEARRAYVAPEPGQTNIHDFFQYNGEADSPSSQDTDEAHDHHRPTYDALQIPSNRLRIADKWILLEEFTILSMGWDTPQFLARRQRQELNFVPMQFHPAIRNSWSDNERQILYGLRLANPGLSWPEQRDARRQQQRNIRSQMRLYNEMEELATLRGFSRIQFNLDAANNNPLPLGMTTSNFDQNFRYLLTVERAIQQFQNVDPDPEELILLSPSYDPNRATREAMMAHRNKITNYTVPMSKIEERRRDLARLQEEQRLRVQEAARLAANKDLFAWLPWQEFRAGDFQDASGTVRSGRRDRGGTRASSADRRTGRRKADGYEHVYVDDDEEMDDEDQRASL